MNNQAEWIAPTKVADQYEKEAIEKWGKRAQNSIELWKSYTDTQRDYVLQQMNENYSEIAKLMNDGAEGNSPKVQELIEKWHQQLYYFYEPSIEVVEGLGTLYKTHPEFRKFYEKIDPKLPDFFGNAISYYADVLETKWIESQYLEMKE